MKPAFNISIWLAGLLGTALVVVASFLWLDRPVALFVHHYLRSQHRDMVESLSHFPNPLITLAAVLSIILGLKMILGRTFSRNQANTFVCSLAVLFTEATKTVLKFLFGRTWPETWTHNNPSFIRDGIYGFNFMHGGTAYQSFPSGHMAAVCTVISVLWIRYPHFRRFYVVVGALTGAGLIGGNYHFVGDVVAGAFLGLSIGWLATFVWDTCVARGLIPAFDLTTMNHKE